MLSFLREQVLGSLSGQKSGGNRSETGASQDTPGQEFLTVATQSSNTRKSTVLIVILFAIGLVCLWFMIQKSKPAGASAASAGAGETQIEAAISRLTGISSEMLSRMDQIVKRFYEVSNVMQVKVDELAKNPFEFEQFLNNLRAKTAAETIKPDNQDNQSKQHDSDAAIALQQQQLKQQLSKEADSLKLSSIVRSAQGNCCMIDDKILYVGDSIKGFRVTNISDSFVEMVWGAQQSSSAVEAKLEEFKVVKKLSQ
jgi:hypothetical protein